MGPENATISEARREPAIADRIVDRLNTIIAKERDNMHLSLNALVRLMGTQPEAIEKSANPPTPPGLINALDALFSELEEAQAITQDNLHQINSI